MHRLLIVLALVPALARADSVDDAARAELARRQIPGMSIAVIDGGKVVRATTYGVVELGGAPVTPATLFQAGSISKSVAALAVLHLVEAGTLSLDDDVNGKLVGWKVPDSDLTRTKKVTLRRILSHTAGLTVHGFPGYAVTDKMPTIVEILDGKPPANTQPIRVDIAPDSQWRYSGGGYTIMQKLVGDVTKKPFAEVMASTVLGPAGMTHSTYQQPLPADQAKLTASGYYGDRTPVVGRWHVYPEMAAAGLWTTPTDLVTFGLEIQRALAGKSKIISAATAKQMLTEVKDGDGLGVFLRGSGKTLQFSHDGRDEGFDALFMAFAETGQGCAIMINANDNSFARMRIVEAIAKQYKWPTAGKEPPAPKPIAVDAKTLERYAGRYERANNDLATYTVFQGKLYSTADDLPDEELVPIGKDRFHAPSGMELVFGANDVTWTHMGHTGTAPRVGALVHTLAKHADPDAAFTKKVLASLQAMATGKSGGDALLSAGLRKDIGNAYPPLAGLTAIEYVDGWSLPTKIERHGAKVDRIVVYKRSPDRKQHYVLAYVTADGLITDFDLVAD